MPKPNKPLQAALKAARDKTGQPYSASRFAAEHGLTASTFRSHLNGTNGTSVFWAKKYAGLFGRPADWEQFANGKGEEKINHSEPSANQKVTSMGESGHDATFEGVETLTPEEQGLIERYRRLGSDGRIKLMTTAERLCDEEAASRPIGGRFTA